MVKSFCKSTLTLPWHFFKRIDNCVQYADDSAVPFTAPQILQTAYSHISSSSLYHNACKTWRKMQPADKTWACFKLFFIDKYQEARKQNHIGNMANNNFQSANTVTDLATALDNLAMATTSDQTVVEQLMADNATFVQTNKT